MPKKISAKDVQAAEAAEDANRLRGIARQLGRALALTIQTALYKAGGSAEDELIGAMDRSWERLVELIVEFAEEDGNAQGL